MKVHLYLVATRFEALIASHLEPEAFGLYMAVGTKKLAGGNVVFFEVDPDLKSDYFRLDNLGERVKPHPDGSPKRSKYIRNYRVLEHLPLPVYGKLYLTTTDGRTLTLDEVPYDAAREEGGPALYQELSPLSPLVASGLPPARFAKFMTDPANPVSCPRLFFADLRLDLDPSGRLPGNLPYPDRAHLEDCVRSLGEGGKLSKTVSRTPRVPILYRVLRRGFFLGDPQGLKHYPFPTREELEIKHAQWWHSASH
jgi:hypothetical protein